MRIIEIRRHSIWETADPGHNLNQQGVSLARLIGEEMGPFDRVITSPLPRAYQTAGAMGYAVDETSELLARLERGLESYIFGGSFREFSTSLHQNTQTKQFGQDLAAFYQQLVKSLPDNGSSLVISHSGIVELSTAACLPESNLSHLGDCVHFCEGVRLRWENDAFTSVEKIKIKKQQYKIRRKKCKPISVDVTLSAIWTSPRKKSRPYLK